jgi:hypothetical protein
VNWSRPARSRINGFLIALVRRLERTLHILPRAMAGINRSVRPELFKCCPVESAPFALCVRSEWPAKVGSLLPREAEPAQILDHGRDKCRPAARRIEIFISQHQHPAMRPLLRDPERPCVAQMQ